MYSRMNNSKMDFLIRIKLTGVTELRLHKKLQICKEKRNTIKRYTLAVYDDFILLLKVIPEVHVPKSMCLSNTHLFRPYFIKYTSPHPFLNI